MSYTIEFVKGNENVIGEYESKVCAYANAQTISRRLKTRVTVHLNGELAKTFEEYITPFHYEQQERSL